MFCSYCGKKTVEGALFCGNCGKRLSSIETMPESLEPQQPESDVQPGAAPGEIADEAGKNSEACAEELKSRVGTTLEKAVSGGQADVADLPHLDVLAALKRVFENRRKKSKFVVPLSRDVSPDARDPAPKFRAVSPDEKTLALFGQRYGKGRFAGILVTDAFVRWRMCPAGSSPPSSCPPPMGLGWKLAEGQIEHAKIASIGFATIDDTDRLFVVNDKPIGLFANEHTNAELLSAATEFCGLVTARPPEFKLKLHSVEWMFNGDVGEELPPARFSYSVAGLCVLMYLLQWMLGAFASDAKFVKVVQSLGGNLPIWGPLVCGFMHGGFIHLVCNVVGLLTFCVSVERIFGTKLFAWAYLASVLGGGVCAAMGEPDATTVGASGGLFGIMGAMCVFGGIRYSLMKNRLSGFDRQKIGRWIKGYGALLWGNIYFTSRFRRLLSISVGGHMGGLLVGLAFGVVALMLVPPRRETTTDNKKMEKLVAWGAEAKKKAGGFWAACTEKIGSIWESGRKGKAICIGVVAVLLLVLMQCGGGSSGGDNSGGTTKTITLPGGATMEMVWCPPGTFMMGSPKGEVGRGRYENSHQVRLTQGFWMAKTEVTQAQWKSVMGKNPSFFMGNNLPVENVSWEDCHEFCKKTGLQLPTEAQWEYACRAGSTTALPNGPIQILGENNAPVLDPIAWYGGNSSVGWTGVDGYDTSDWSEKQYPSGKAGTHPVGKKKPNAWGLYDMIGNVWEWCEDWYGAYPSGSVTNPRGASSGTDRVARGGSWGSKAAYCRSASRFLRNPLSTYNVLGFRPVKILSE